MKKKKKLDNHSKILKAIEKHTIQKPKNCISQKLRILYKKKMKIYQEMTNCQKLKPDTSGQKLLYSFE